MSNEMTPTASATGLAQVLGGLAPSKFGSDDDFNKLSSAGAFLPRLMLMGTNSTLVQEDKIKAGAYGLVRSKESCEDLTKEVPVLPLSWRSKAMKITNDEVISVFDRKNPLFDKIAEESETPDSGCMYGPEFLLWIPSAKSFATFYCSSKTSRREALNIRNQIGKPTLMKSQLIKGKKFNWWGPVVTTYSGILSVLPTVEEITEEVTKFNNPAESEKEAAPEGAASRVR